MLPFSICAGAVFLIWADVLARTLMPNSELPLGLITSAVGAPLLLYMILKRGFATGGK
jgi:iron complex transport system permease protein